MSRDANGNFTLVSGNPVVSGTVIESTWANNTLSDLATEMTDSLNRSGKGGMLAALKGVNGTVSVPMWSFTNDFDTGIYLAAVADMRITVAGVDYMTFATAEFTLTVAGTTLVANTDGFTINSDGTIVVIDGDGLTCDAEITGTIITGTKVIAPLAINAQIGTSYTAVLTDQVITMNNAAANTLTVPPNSSVAFDIGHVLAGYQLGAGQTTLVEGVGVTINSPRSLVLAGTNEPFALLKIATNTWQASGGFVA